MGRWLDAVIDGLRAVADPADPADPADAGAPVGAAAVPGGP